MSARRPLLRLCCCTGCEECASDPRIDATVQPCATPSTPTNCVCRWCRRAGGGLRLVGEGDR